MTKTRLEIVQAIARGHEVAKRDIDPALCRAIEEQIVPIVERAASLIREKATWDAYNVRWCWCPMRIGDPRQHEHTKECDTMNEYLGPKA